MDLTFFVVISTLMMIKIEWSATCSGIGLEHIRSMFIFNSRCSVQTSNKMQMHAPHITKISLIFIRFLANPMLIYSLIVTLVYQ